MKFNKGDKVIIKSIKVKGTIESVRYSFIGSSNSENYYMVNYGGSTSGFKAEHLEIDKEYYRDKKINDILKNKDL